MAIDLSKMVAPSQRKGGKIFTFFGEGGIGKTSLAATFPAPYFICCEDGTVILKDNKEVRMLPEIAKTTDGVREELKALIEQKHDRKTIVIDTITQMHTFLESEIIKKDNAKGINSALGGYGNGYSACSEIHKEIRELCDILMERGINIVILGHAEIEKLDLPDTDPYSRYSIRMHQKSLKHWSDNVDLVGFIKEKTFIRGEKGKLKKATSDGTRVIICHKNAACIAKNRFKITKEFALEEGKNPFLSLL